MSDLDLSKYDGHTEGTWDSNLYLGGAYAIDRCAPNGDRIAHIADVLSSHAKSDARLIADAPLLLAEVRRLREENGELKAQNPFVAGVLAAKYEALRQSHARLLAAIKADADAVEKDGSNPCWCELRGESHAWWCVELRAAVAEAEAL